MSRTSHALVTEPGETIHVHAQILHSGAVAVTVTTADGQVSIHLESMTVARGLRSALDQALATVQPGQTSAALVEAAEPAVVAW